MDFAKILAKLDSIESKQNLNEGWEDMMKASKEKSEKKEKEKGTGKFDKKETSTGTVYTRKSSTFDDGGDDKDVKKAKKKEKEDKKSVKEDELDEGVFGDIAKKGVDVAKKVGSKALDTLGHGSDEDLIKNLQKNAGVPVTGKKPEPPKTVSEETDLEEDDVEEGNAFSGAMAKAKAAGKTEFEVDGKKYQVKESKDEDEDDTDDKDDDEKDTDDKDDDKEKVDESQVADGQVKWATANAGRFVNHYTARGKTVQEAMSILYKTSHERARKLSENKRMAECYDQAMSQGQESGMNISSNMDTKSGDKSLTVSARGEAAQELAQILKLSGLLGHGHSDTGPEVEVAQEEYANEPEPMVQSHMVQLKQGNDMHRSKGTYPKVAGGDNPMQAMMEDKTLAMLESKLLKELESIKIKR